MKNIKLDPFQLELINMLIEDKIDKIKTDIFYLKQSESLDIITHLQDDIFDLENLKIHINYKH